MIKKAEPQDFPWNGILVLLLQVFFQKNMFFEYF